jgi:hypothetical protein
MGRLLIAVGLVIAAVGALLLAAGKVSWLGRLPGDILIEKRNFTLYFPLATSILASIVLTLLFYLVGRR